MIASSIKHLLVDVPFLSLGIDLLGDIAEEVLESPLLCIIVDAVDDTANIYLVLATGRVIALVGGNLVSNF